jgi:hypothetical protein
LVNKGVSFEGTTIVNAGWEICESHHFLAGTILKAEQLRLSETSVTIYQ